MNFERHVPNLVEEQGPAVGRFDLANHSGAPGACERAVDIAEELADQNVARQTAAIQSDERATPAAPALMDCSRNHVLSDPGLTL